jgi:hypothetical protein
MQSNVRNPAPQRRSGGDDPAIIQRAARSLQGGGARGRGVSGALFHACSRPVTSTGMTAVLRALGAENRRAAARGRVGPALLC